jgi:hypothetical protein
MENKAPEPKAAAMLYKRESVNHAGKRT